MRDTTRSLARQTAHLRRWSVILLLVDICLASLWLWRVAWAARGAG